MEAILQAPFRYAARQLQTFSRGMERWTEERRMHEVLDLLSEDDRQLYLRPTSGSSQEKFCLRMVKTGYLQRLPFGYVLADLTRRPSDGRMNRA